ncbi:hypothetical protein F5883DRAFT_547663 [Diaporthe sp. PMI_573]|nr:hypothetical protein F5883DRAFT_547663 [Diaporthaceae sp. PMI_573]
MCRYLSPHQLLWPSFSPLLVLAETCPKSVHLNMPCRPPCGTSGWVPFIQHHHTSDLVSVPRSGKAYQLWAAAAAAAAAAVVNHDTCCSTEL